MTGTSKPKNKFFKLVKNDFLASARVISLFYIAIAVLFAVFGICVLIQGSSSASAALINKAMTIRNVSIVLSILVSFLLIFVTFFFVVYDFFKSLYSQQGYLSFSLPVSSNQLLGSKVLVYGGWLIVSYAVFMFTSVFLMNYTADQVIGVEKISLAKTLMEMLGDFPSTTQLIAYAVYTVMMFFIIILSFVSIIYFAITVSHVRLLQKHSIFASIIIFFITALVFLWISFKMSDLVNFVMVFNDDHTLSFGILSDGYSLANGNLGMEITPAFSFVILDVIMFFATSYIMHKKVNIK
ncbi:MAG: hypothetical protein ACI4I3_07085 [Acutalibacteraceae bacterium]